MIFVVSVLAKKVMVGNAQTCSLPAKPSGGMNGAPSGGFVAFPQNDDLLILAILLHLPVNITRGVLLLW